MRGRTTVLIAFLLSATLGGYFAGPLLVPNGDRRSMLPGPTSRGHQAFESACERCHTPFGGVTNQACLQCHGHQLTASEDSHPESKFTENEEPQVREGVEHTLVGVFKGIGLATDVLVEPGEVLEPLLVERLVADLDDFGALLDARAIRHTG